MAVEQAKAFSPQDILNLFREPGHFESPFGHHVDSRVAVWKMPINHSAHLNEEYQKRFSQTIGQSLVDRLEDCQGVVTIDDWSTGWAMALAEARWQTKLIEVKEMVLPEMENEARVVKIRQEPHKVREVYHEVVDRFPDKDSMSLCLNEHLWVMPEQEEYSTTLERYIEDLQKWSRSNKPLAFLSVLWGDFPPKLGKYCQALEWILDVDIKVVICPLCYDNQLLPRLPGDCHSSLPLDTSFRQLWFTEEACQLCQMGLPLGKSLLAE
jgi:hypothetical protein